MSVWLALERVLTKWGGYAMAKKGKGPSAGSNTRGEDSELSGYSDEEVTQFQKLYWDEFHKEIDRHEARKQLNALVTLVRISYRPITKTQVMRLAERNIREGRVKPEDFRSA